MIVLARGDTRLEITPQIGGAVTRLTWRGLDVLRPTIAGANHPLQTSSFPLVPYSNRIAHGTFSFAGRNVHLHRNLEGDAHPLHGKGWLNPWRVIDHSAEKAVLGFEHAPDDWPWSFTSEQVITLLDERRIRMEVSVHNSDARPMPAGLGFHPAFPAPADARLHADVTGVWLIDDTILPTKHLPSPGIVDWGRNPQLVDAQGMDHCHTGWKGPAVITLPASGLKLTITAGETMRWLHLYVPKERGFFCLEPVSQMPDPFNQPNLDATGIVTLEPGHAYSCWMEIEVASTSEKPV
jgi:aldose 1-epimerase